MLSDTTLCVILSILTFIYELNDMISLALRFLISLVLASNLHAEGVDDTSDKMAGLQKWRTECFKDNNLGSCAALSNALKSSSDSQERQKVLMKLCDGQDGQSCLYLGRAAEKNHATEDATVWFRKACDQGVEKGSGCVAMAKLAVAQKNEKNATIWLKKACSHGDQPSCKLAK